MDNEFNKKEENQFGSENNQFVNDDMLQSQYQSSENNETVDSVIIESKSDYGNSDSDNLNSIYPKPEINEEHKKSNKKHKFSGPVKFTAAAVAFGLVAGMVFQGINYVADQNETVIIQQNKGSETAANDGKKTSGTTDKSSTTAVPVNTTSGTVVSDVSDIVDKVMPSIVAINATSTVTDYDFFGRQYNEKQEGSGSGIIIGQNSSQILVVTNNHVIDGATTVQITFSDKSKVSAKVKGADKNADLAVLSVNKKDLSNSTLSTVKVATLGDSGKVKAGEMAIAIGNALGYGQSVTVGYISAVNREVAENNNNTMKLLQTDAAINPGNSGGALINASGEVIGINSMKYASEEVEGMGYAIPISKAIPMINELMNRETVKTSEQGFLGINKDSAQNVTSVTAERFHMPVGVYINEVVKNSPAEKAGLKQGNIIVGLDATKIETIDDLISALSYKKAGETIQLKIKVLDKGEYVSKTLSVTLGEKN